MARSLRSQLLVHIALTTLLVFSIAAATTFVLLRKSLLDEFDSLLDAKVQAMAKLVEQDHDKLRIEFVEHQLHEFVRDQAREYYEVWDAKGRVIARSPHLGKYDLLDDPKQMADETVFAFAELPDGRRGRITATKFVPIIDDESLLASDTRGDTKCQTNDTCDRVWYGSNRSNRGANRLDNFHCLGRSLAFISMCLSLECRASDSSIEDIGGTN